jgi:peptidoglycan/xylan/chitin deacetylase (PgdA/CDA1 family)
MIPWKYPAFMTRILHPEAIFWADPSRNRVYLTYDDGPDPEITPKLLEVLAEYNARVTFFVINDLSAWWPGLIKTISQKGHAVALHGLEHRGGYLKSNQTLLSELSSLADRIKSAGVEPLNYYRPPFGHIRPDTIRYLSRRGYRTVLWSNIPGDFRVMNQEKLFRRAMKDTLPGSILVLHDGNILHPAPTIDLTRSLLEEFTSRDWQCDSLQLV